MSYFSEVMADGPVVYYRMNDASGNPVDSSGNGLNVTGTSGGGSATYSQPGAIASDPSSTSIKINPTFAFTRTNNALMNFGNVFTVEMWVRKNADGSIMDLASKNTTGWGVTFTAANTVRLEAVAIGDITTSTVALTVDGRFHHIVATDNGISTGKIYIDGVDCGSAPLSTSVTDTVSDLRIAEYTGAPYNGWIDELALYPTALSQARVLAHYNAAVVVPGLDDDPPIGILGRGAGW